MPCSSPSELSSMSCARQVQRGSCVDVTLAVTPFGDSWWVVCAAPGHLYSSVVFLIHHN